MQRLSRLTLCAFCLSLKMFAASALAEPPALAEIEDLLADRNYPEAIAQLRAALRQPPEPTITSPASGSTATARTAAIISSAVMPSSLAAAR